MNLNNIDIKLKIRNNIQAVNLGFVLARRYKFKLIFATFIASLPIFIISTFLLYYLDNKFWGILLFWLFKPYYDRVILLNLSKLIFNNDCSYYDIYKSIFPAMKNGLFLNLTFFRLSSVRNVSLPVKLLEGLSGNDYSKRVKLISSQVSGAASGVMFILSIIEQVIFINIIFIIFYSLGFSFEGYLDFPKEHISYLSLLVYFFIVVILEMFYVCSGFMLYINRRVFLEGWDTEIDFVNMANRYKSKFRTTNKIKAFSILAVCFLGFSLFAPTPSEAVKLTPIKDKKIIEKIISKKSIYPYEKQYKWEKINKEKKKEKKKKKKKNDFDLDYRGSAAWVASLLKFILILGLVSVVIYIVRYVVSNDLLANLRTGKKNQKKTKKPKVLFGLEVTEKSLPKEINQLALILIEEGKLVEALSLLYRGGLSYLINELNVNIHKSYTEGDCLKVVAKNINKQDYIYFSKLTKSWVALVYAKITPTKDEMIILVKNWDKTFSPNKKGDLNE